ncbi:MAG: hypothetical protein LIO62_01040 [Clostridiales bacterium]|nr:hypothetical protein [Clostridiales bacterium]
MKKLLSIIFAAVMAISACMLCAVPAMAADDDATVISPGATAITGPVLQVNGAVTTTDVTVTPDENNSSIITFTYTGEGTVTGWENNLEALGFVEGVDFIATMNEDGSYTIEFLTDEAYDAYETGDLIVNAIVEFDEDEEETEGSEATTSATTTTASTNTSSTSPSTGASTGAVAGGIAAVAGAGIAVLLAAKKKDAE